MIAVQTNRAFVLIPIIFESSCLQVILADLSTLLAWFK